MQASKPDDVARAYGMRPAEVLDLGETEIDIGTFEDFLAEIKGKYTAATYNLMVRGLLAMGEQFISAHISYQGPKTESPLAPTYIAAKQLQPLR